MVAVAPARDDGVLLGGGGGGGGGALPPAPDVDTPLRVVLEPDPVPLPPEELLVEMPRPVLPRPFPALPRLPPPANCVPSTTSSSSESSGCKKLRGLKVGFRSLQPSTYKQQADVFQGAIADGGGALWGDAVGAAAAPAAEGPVLQVD